MKSNPRSPSATDQPAQGATTFGRMWASLGGRSAQERAAKEAAEAAQEAALQLARAREILQQDRATSRTRRRGRTTEDQTDATVDAPEQTGTRPSVPAQFIVDVHAWITEAIAGLASDGATPIAVPAAPANENAATTDLAPATVTLALATTELAPAPTPRPTSACTEPIRTRTMARLLGKQGYRDRALSIYDHLLSETPGDASLRAEAEILRSNEVPGPATDGT